MLEVCLKLNPGTELNPACFTYGKSSWDLGIFSPTHSEASGATFMNK